MGGRIVLVITAPSRKEAGLTHGVFGGVVQVRAHVVTCSLLSTQASRAPASIGWSVLLGVMPKVVVASGLEIFHQDLPAERAVPFTRRLETEPCISPMMKNGGDIGPSSSPSRLFGRQRGRLTVEVHKDKAFPGIGCEKIWERKVVPLEAFGPAHFRTGLEAAIEFEGPGVT